MSYIHYIQLYQLDYVLFLVRAREESQHVAHKVGRWRHRVSRGPTRS